MEIKNGSQSQAAPYSDVNIDYTTSYNILNFYTVFSAISQYIKCKTFGSDIQFQEISKRGLGFKVVLTCNECDDKYIHSCLYIRNSYEIYRRFIFAKRLLRIGHQGCERFCAFMDLPRPIFQSFYDNVGTIIHDTAKSVCDLSLKRSTQEEKQKISEAENIENPAGLSLRRR